MPVEVAEQEACRKIIMHRLSLKKWNYEFQLDHNRDRLSICGSLMIKGEGDTVGKTVLTFEDSLFAIKKGWVGRETIPKPL